MILMSKYKGQHDGKRVKKFGQGPPPFRAMPERKRFFLDVPLLCQYYKLLKQGNYLMILKISH